MKNPWLTAIGERCTTEIENATDLLFIDSSFGFSFHFVFVSLFTFFAFEHCRSDLCVHLNLIDLHRANANMGAPTAAIRVCGEKVHLIFD